MRPANRLSQKAAPADSLGATVLATLRVGAGAALLVGLALAAVVAHALLTEPAMGQDVPGPDAMMAVSPGGVLPPGDVPPALGPLYRAAERHYEIFQHVPCFCGCEAMLGHRHLGDCFIRADGQGREAHALGCGVCLGEAQQVDDLVGAGITDPGRIKEAVVAEWGDPYQSEEPPA